MKAMRLVLTAFLFALATCAPVNAQTAQCAGLADVLEGLDRNYGEDIVWQGSGWGDSLLMVTAKPDGTTWAVIIVLENQACLVASGAGWSGIGHPVGESI